jgi:hypothetical protein
VLRDHARRRRERPHDGQPPGPAQGRFEDLPRRLHAHVQPQRRAVLLRDGPEAHPQGQAMVRRDRREVCRLTRQHRPWSPAGSPGKHGRAPRLEPPEEPPHAHLLGRGQPAGPPGSLSPARSTGVLRRARLWGTPPPPPRRRMSPWRCPCESRCLSIPRACCPPAARARGRAATRNSPNWRTRWIRCRATTADSNWWPWRSRHFAYLERPGRWAPELLGRGMKREDLERGCARRGRFGVLWIQRPAFMRRSPHQERTDDRRDDRDNDHRPRVRAFV